jgi:DNA-binding NtrC family response regulator
MENRKEFIKVLIADDEVEFASTLKTRLNLRNFKADAVHSGFETLEAINRDKPDVLVLDLQMPDLSGLEVLAKVKQQFEDIEVIILTGHGSFEAGREGMERGAYDYIMKPVELRLLTNKIEEAYQAAKKKV